MSGLKIDFPDRAGAELPLRAGTRGQPGGDRPGRLGAGLGRLEGLWHFNGIDNAFYFAILYPAIFAAAGVQAPRMRGATVNELYLLEGQKFSTSRNHALWADEFLTEQDPELVRLYLSWYRPDRYESDFTHESFEAFCAFARPLLDGASRAGAQLPGELAAGELERAERAL